MTWSAIATVVLMPNHQCLRPIKPAGCTPTLSRRAALVPFSWPVNLGYGAASSSLLLSTRVAPQTGD